MMLFGVKGHNLVKGEFTIYEILVNGQYAGLVQKPAAMLSWSCFTDKIISKGHSSPQDAIENLKDYLRSKQNAHY